MLPYHRASTGARRSASSTANDRSSNMAPSTNAINRSKKRRRPKQSPWLIFAACTTVLWTLGIFFWAQSLVGGGASEPDHPAPHADITSVPRKDEPVRVYELWPDDLESKEFFDTLKDCNSANAKEKHCIEYVPDGTTTQRIGVLRPHGALGLFFDQFVQQVVSIHGTNETDLQLIPTSSVPPYGYGKTHGYTKIIRCAVMPLTLAATDVVRSFPQPSSDKGYTVEDLRQAVRQLIRWHCRLSHVAAHTRLLTLTLESIVEDPWEMEFKVKNFLDLGSAETGDVLDHVLEKKHIDEDELSVSLDLVVRHISALLTKIDHVERPKEKLDVLLKAVVDSELSATHNLKDWPCLSFWKNGLDSKSEVALNSVNRKIAALFSPNCTAGEYSECIVPRDRCEAKGDAICGGKK